MQQFNFPTIIYFGEQALQSLATTLKQKQHKKALLVTDKTLTELGIANKVSQVIQSQGVDVVVFDDVHPNPIEQDVELGSQAFILHHCDCLIALGGGSPMDVAKVIKVASTHPGPLAQYDDAIGGDKLIVNDMPALYAIPTTAGTGSEVGRSGVIILRESGQKTIIFAPQLMPDIAVLAPELTIDLPAHITAATGIDAFTHCLEAYFAPGFHPMADGIALEGMRLCLQYLATCVEQGDNINARGQMQMAATMGATAFQKGLGMTHSLAHPLSAEFNTHHGLANALLLPFSLEFIEQHGELNSEQKEKISAIKQLFYQYNIDADRLSQCCLQWFTQLGITFGLSQHGISEQDIAMLADKAFDDPCHHSNMVSVSRDDLYAVYAKAL
ncbi:iron-containing alcohol dehydrogenase [Thalassotalea sp. Y01]|uniref:iron-containing alcohol dehydrogenase n=1 Tax=Thalassotalea sp. Y01 TaxID=2729613 RepID=UPI00145DE8F7|nr:iron-containing alcohol dehydrogenase [Thalassotalea sp. Y01]NMP16359.1 iron-containing alcohol dehydrogenase [Thalassotalea sp. Y01]